MTDATISGRINLPLHITKLEGPEGYQVWSREMEQYLIAANLWKWRNQPEEPTEPTAKPAAAVPQNQLQGSEAQPAAQPAIPSDALLAKIANWTLGHSLASNAIHSRLGSNLIADYRHERNFATLWSSIQTNCKPKGSGTLNDLYRRLLKLNLGSAKSATEYAGKFKHLHLDITEMAPNLCLETNFLIFLFHTGLGREYEQYFTHYSQTHDPMSADNDKPAFSLEYAVTRFIQTVQNPSASRDRSSQAFAAHQPQRQSRGGGGAVHVSEHDQKGAVAGKHSRLISRLVKRCTHCNKDFHTESECREKNPNLPATSKSSKTKDTAKTNTDDKQSSKRPRTNDSDDVDEAFVAYTAEVDTDKAWALDTACSQHLTSDRTAFQEYRVFDPEVDHVSPMKGLSGSLIPQGVGKVKLHLSVNGFHKTITLSSVLYIPNAPINLVSLGQLHRNGCPITFFEDGITVGHRGITAQRQRNNLYHFELWQKPTPLAMLSHGDAGSKDASVEPEEQTPGPSTRPQKGYNQKALDIWHARHGHLGLQNLKKLAHMSTGMDLSKEIRNDPNCEPCAVAKLKTEWHKGHIVPGRYENELIHSDLTTLGEARDGSKYFATFMDDKTKASWVKPIPYKGPDTFYAFQEFKARVEHGDCKIHRLRSDNGGEYSSDEFKDYRAEHGILWESIIPGNPQMNGVAERLGQTLMAMVSAIIYDTGLDWDLWPWLVVTANYLRNRQPVSGRSVTPFEARTGVPPRLSHLRRIGTWGHALARRPQFGWAKGQRRAEKCRLIGYEGDHIYLVIRQGDATPYRCSRVWWGKEKEGLLETPPDNDYSSSPARGESSKNPTAEELPPLPSTFDYAYLDDSIDIPIISQPSQRETSPATLVQEPSEQSQSSEPTQSPGTIPTDTPPEWLEHFPYLQERDLSPDPLALDSYAYLTKALASEPMQPKTYAEAMSNNMARAEWQLAMKDEYQSLIENRTWTLCPRPAGRKPLDGKWVYTLKRGPMGEITRYKARWVVRGFQQREGLDFNETFASVVKPMSYKAIFAIAAALDWDLEQMDVKTAFLYGNVEEEIWVEQPIGYHNTKHPEWVCKLHKALYGLKQSPRVWYTTFARFLKKHGFIPINADSSVFINPTSGTIVALYVDDVQITGPSKQAIQTVKNALNKEFRMTDLGPCAFYLGMTITRDRPNRILRLGQAGYVEKMLRTASMWECKPVATPMETTSHPQPAEEGYTASHELLKAYQSAVGSLMYAMLGTRPDLAYSVSVLSRYASNPAVAHWAAVKRVFRYLRATVNLQLTFQGRIEPLNGFTDSDWAGDSTRRSTSGYVFSIGSGIISWSSKRQATVALSTCEAEYIGMTEASKEAIWLRRLLAQLHPSSKEPQAVIIYGDNQGAIALAKNPEFHARTKHIDIRQHYVREQVENGSVELQYVPTDKQVADGLTKALCKEKFIAFRKALGLELPP